MRKVILDFYDVVEEMLPMEKAQDQGEPQVFLADTPENRLKDYKELVHEYIGRQMNFACEIKSRDGLYDALSDISEPTAIGFFLPTMDFDDLSIDLMMYLDKVKNTFLEAENDNAEFLAVIMAESGNVLPEDEDPDEELDELMKDILGRKL